MPSRSRQGIPTSRRPGASRRALGITAEPLRLDSQAKYAVVARGDASIYLRLPHGGYRENVWDHAAGWLIVSEAGGRVIGSWTAGRSTSRPARG